MTQLSVTDQRCLAALLKLNFQIEDAAMKSLHSMRLPLNFDSLAAAERAMKDKSPLYVAAIELHGDVCRDQFDDHPGYAFFHIQGVRTHKAPAYCGLERAKELGLQFLQAQHAEAKAEDREQEGRQYDGRFWAERIILRDQFGGVLQEYARRWAPKGDVTGWLQEVPEHAECVGLLEEAATLGGQAALEHGSDNFETARGLRKLSDALSRKVQIAERQGRVIH